MLENEQHLIEVDYYSRYFELERMSTKTSSAIINKLKAIFCDTRHSGEIIKQLLDEVEHDIMNYQNRGLCYLPRPKAEADNTDTRF